MLKKCWRIFAAGLVAFVLFSPGLVRAASAPALAVPAGLSFAEIKMTGAEFVMLQNNSGSDITDLSSYWLYGFNKTNPLDAGVSSSSQQLPAGTLLGGQTLLLSDGGSTCGAAITDSLSVSLGDSAGYLEIVKSSLTGGLLVQTAGDAVSWSSGINSAPGMISNVPSNSKDPNGAWYRYHDAAQTPEYQWQQADISSTDSCQLTVTISSVPVPGPTPTGNLLLPSLPPPATIISISAPSGSTQTTGMPVSDIGLRAPVLNELLPNPKSPQTDSQDEFIEIYNPNNASFDLSGFKLQNVSSTSPTKHTYTFPSGTKVAAKGFATYPSSNISISLSNNGGQVWLLDPAGSVISQTDVYGKAAEGMAWALANGKWYWTTTPTPGKANVINGSGVASGSSGTGVGVVEGAKFATGLASTAAGSGNKDAVVAKSSSLHPMILVGIGALAVLYGVYEYRGDIANKYQQFQRNRAARRANRKKS